MSNEAAPRASRNTAFSALSYLLFQLKSWKENSDFSPKLIMWTYTALGVFFCFFSLTVICLLDNI